ncbi:hypothetical protein BST83_00295 [Polaribacter filamentus]|uniref:PKD domain-containing protein n=1 Tax=Polaribacter filamentus TaxID=53483 RepID=A0A2S7L1U9_9FLAO|nr:PKD domain-containing protein [Polaribacter filamentus]PQB08847.1 hypothetical protein BST83_00295 [Polaribacter filamentus]
MKKIIRTPSKHFIYILFFVFGFLTSFKGSAQITISSVVVNSCTGSITVTVGGGDGNYGYKWFKENQEPPPNNWDPLIDDDWFINDQAPGRYRVIVTDANDEVEGVYDISESVDLIVTEIFSGLVCPEDLNSGVIILRFRNGFPPYTWTLAGSTERAGIFTPTDTPYYLSIDNIPVGNYTFAWTDDFGCSGTEEITVSAPPITELTINTTTDVLCFGDSNGGINISLTGGWGPNYAINIVSDGQAPQPIENFTNIGDGTSYTINNLAAGTYQIYYYDKLANPPLTTTYGLDVSNYNCAKSKTFTINTPLELISTPTGELLSCFGDTDGNITGTITGGTAPYSITLDGTATQITVIADGDSFNFSGLSAGTYDFTITDAVNCSITAQALITQPDELITGFVSKQDVSCNAGTDGNSMVSVTGGTAPYIFKVDGVLVTPTLASGDNYTIGNLSAGTYNITITDQNNCTASTVITQTIKEPSSLAVAASGETLTCFGDSDGNITGSISGGTAPYNITLMETGVQFTGIIDGGAFDFSGLSAGTYNFTITDAKDCTTTVQETINTPLELISTPAGELLSCFGATDGNVTGTITGGTAPYTIKLDGTATQITGIADGGSFDFSELSVGTYNFTITDAVGCIDTAQAAITQPDELITDFVSKQDVSCNTGTDGNIIVSVTGGTAAYIFKVDGVLVTPTLASGTNYTIGNLSAGTYNITITDQNDCTATTDIEQTITEPAEISLSLVSFENLSCFNSGNGSITVGVTGGTLSTTPGAPNYIFTLTGPSAVIAQDNGGGTWTFGSLDEGTYTISVTDQNNCISNPAQITQELTQPLAINFTALEQDISCNGTEDGSIDIIVTGGTIPYTYLWTSPNGFNATTQDISALAPGEYSITVIDDNGCTVEETYTIEEPDVLGVLGDPFDYSGYGVSGNGLSDGIIDITVTGGTTPYTYSWTSLNGTIPVGQETQQNLSNLNAGTYTLLITDKNGCTITKTWEITEPFELLINENPASHVDVLCFGENTGVIKVVVTQQSVGPYDYAITDSSGVEVERVTDQNAVSYVFDDLLADTYTVTVTDANGISKSINNIIIAQPLSLLEISSEIISDFNGFGISCNGAADGSIDITVSGGTTPYTYVWEGPNGFSATSQDISALSPGDYTITVTDANGCITSPETYTITEPDVLGLAGDLSDYNGFGVTGNGLSDGIIDITVTGGAIPYSYSWASLDGSIPVGQETQQNLSNLNAGTYTVQITDTNGCTITDTWIITEPQELLILEEIASHVDVLCFGENTGVIKVVVDQGSVAPYDYAITNSLGVEVERVTDQNAVSYVFDELLADTYTVTVTDANEISKSINNIIIAQPAAILSIDTVDLSLNNGFNISCNGAADGSIDITVSGGTTPYTYVWEGPSGFNETTQNISALSPGDYTITVTDANGCITSPETYTITEPDVLGLAGDLSDYNGFGVTGNGLSDGIIDITVTGGAIPYSYSWASLDGSIPVGQETQQNLSNLNAGTYTVQITDTNGCTITDTWIITEPQELLILEEIASHVDVLCFGENTGVIKVVVDQGSVAPYDYAITNSLGVEVERVTDQNAVSYVFDELLADTYTVTVTDANEISKSINNIIIAQPAAILSIDTVDLSLNNGFNISCNGAADGSIDITVSGGTTPYTYVWEGPNGFSATSQDISALSPGDYTITVTDANGCITSPETYTITEPDVLVLGGVLSNYNGFGVSGNGLSDGSIDITVTGGTTEYTYSWTSSDGIIPSGQETQEDLTGLNAGTYTVLIKDANDCTITKTWEITEPQELLISEETASHVDVLCFGENTGVIEVVVDQGSVAPYDYAITNSLGVEVERVTDQNAVSYVFDELLADTYTATVTDANGISKSINNIIIAQPLSLLEISSEIISDFNGFGISCNGASDGSIDITVSGGAAGYTYAWTSPNGFNATTQDISAFAPGAYSITVTDANGCSTSPETYTITEPTALVLGGVLSNYNGFGVSGNGLSDGRIDITVAGGTTLYTYSWTSLNGTIPVGQETQEDLTGLNAGTYTVLIKDANDCTITKTWEITEPQELLISEEIASHVDVLCFGENTGVIKVVVDQGSVAPYEYTITDSSGVEVERVTDQNAVSYVFDELLADTYTVTVTDANGISKSINNIIIAQPLSLLEISSEIISDFNGFGISCNGAADGSINITVSGGAPGYTYAWTGPNGFSATSQDISALAPGAYRITVTDANGCSTSPETYTITEPTALVLGGVLSNYNGFGVSGNGLSDGRIDITVTGGTTEYTYSWTSSDGIIPSGQETQEDLTGLNAGTYTVLIKDANDCTITKTWEITEPQELLISEETASHVDVLCFGENTGVIEVVVDQGSVAPYDYAITNSLGVEVERVTDQNAVSYVFDELRADTYTVTVTDANGISKSINNIIITQPAAILSIDTVDLSLNNGFNISCNGAADGSIDITVSGGTTPCTYVWEGPSGFNETTQNISALAPGAYTITVTDANGCSTSPETYTITEPTALVLGGVLSNYNGFGVSGNGLSDGSIDITVNGGTTPYNYSWTSLDGSIPSGQETQQNLSNLNAGTYTVQITDTNGCTIADSWTITEPNELVISEETASHVDVLCFGENKGVIEVVVDQGSVAPYDYKITNSLGVVVEQVNAQTALNYVFDVLFADTYTVTVTDANGISKSINNIIITEPLSLLEISSEIISDFNGFGISCNGASDGSIDITVSGGAAGYTYAWTSPNGFNATTQDISALAPGEYTITVTDANGCSTSPETYTITEPDEIIINTTLLQDVQCFENSDGKIEITITGGTGDFTYNWTKNSTPYATTKNLAGLSPGEYVLIVQEDGNAQCYRTKTFTITQPDLLEIAFESKTDILCYGDSTGSAQISVTGGTSPYQYSWMEASGATYNTQDLVGVPAGDYQLTVIDALGCSDTFNVILNEPDNIVLNESKTDITCFGSNDGTISIAVTGGVSPYTYVWSDLGSGPLRRDLAPGIYDVTVTDSNNCQKMVQFEIIEAPLFKIDPITTHISCFGATDGSIDLNLVGGIAPLNITWGDGNSAGLIRNNLSAGSYSVFIEDAVGCSIAKNFSIIEPNEIVLDAVVINAIDCTDPNSGSIDLQVVGGTAPFIFLWSNGSTTEDLQNIGANNYTVTVTDSRGCEEQKTVVVTRQTSLVLSLNTSIIPDCINKTVTQRNELEVTGGVAPYSVSWSNGMVSGANSEIMETTQNGTVIVEVIDSLGCTEQLVFDINLFILGDPSFNYSSFANTNYGILSIEDPITFNSTSTGDILTYLWSFGDGNTSTDKDPIHTYVAEGTYEVTLTVQYPYGCSYVDTMTVNIGKGYDIVIPNAFTPNDDGLNDVIRPVYIGMIDVEMSIYSTWEGLIYFEKGLELNGWNGTIKNSLAENGNYIIKVKATTFYGLVLSFNRPITLIK